MPSEGKLCKASLIVLCLASLYRPCTCQDETRNEAQGNYSVPIGILLPVERAHLDVAFRKILNRLKTNNYARDLYRTNDVQPVAFDNKILTTNVKDSFLLSQAFCEHVSHRSKAMIGFYDRSSADTIASFSEAFQIPWITPSIATPTALSSPYIISLLPRLEKFIFNFVRLLAWKRFSFIYDMHEVHLPIERVVEFGWEQKVSIEFHNLAGKANLSPFLTDISRNNENNLILDISRDRALQVIEEAHEAGMLTVEYHYIFTDLSLMMEDLSKYTQRISNLTFLSLTNFSRKMPLSPPVSSFADVIDPGSFFTSFGNDEALMYDAFSALAIGINHIASQWGDSFQQQIKLDQKVEITCKEASVVTHLFGPEISKAIKKVQFEGATGIVQFDENGNRINYTVGFYTLDSLGFRLNGQWKDKGGETSGTFTFNENGQRNKNALQILRDQTLVVTTILEEPYMTLKKNAEELEGNDIYEGFCVDLLTEITKLAPFRYIIKPVRDGQYGSKNATDGRWNGMIGEVKYQKADLAVAPLTITSAREGVVDFTKPFMSLGISVMIKKSKKPPPQTFRFLEPLSREIWICIFFAYFGVSVVLYVVSRFSPYEWHRSSILVDEDKESEEVDSTTDFSFKNTLWFSLGSFVQQGSDVTPKSLSGRIVGGVWWFFTLIIISSYTANLAAFLTQDRMTSTIQGAEDLAKQSTVKYGTLKSGSTVNFFKLTPLTIYQKMWGNMLSQSPSVFVNSNHEGIERVRNSQGTYAFLMESSLNEYVENRKPCNTRKVGPNIDSKGYGIAFPKSSPFHDSVNMAILILQEQGKLQKMKNYWWNDRSECGPPKNTVKTKTTALTLNNVVGIFYLLIAGAMLAIFSAIVEYCYAVHLEKITDVKKKLITQLRALSGRDEKTIRRHAGIPEIVSG